MISPGGPRRDKLGKREKDAQQSLVLYTPNERETFPAALSVEAKVAFTIRTIGVFGRSLPRRP
jgi:hypothetical protein